MKKKYSIILAIIFSGMTLGKLCAQEAVISSGVSASGSGGSVSYSVGQIVYTTNIGTNGSVAQGVQQPFEISVVLGLEDAKDISLNCIAYPNPTSSFLILKINDNVKSDLKYQLFDFNGKLLESKKTDSPETNISLENFPSAIYFLKVIQDNINIKTFKIIKN